MSFTHCYVLKCIYRRIVKWVVRWGGFGLDLTVFLGVVNLILSTKRGLWSTR